MKRVLFSLVVAFSCIASAWSAIPAGTTIYLDCSQAWCCAPSYLIHFSSLSYTYLMTPDPTHAGVYCFTATATINQDNVNFGIATTKQNFNFSGWFGDVVSANKETNFSSSKPYYIVTGADGSGYWAAQPASTGVNSLDNVSVTVAGMNCIDSTYSVTVSVEYGGAPCGMVINGVKGTKSITNLTGSPYEYVMDNLSDAAEGVSHSVIVTLYSDAGLTTVIGTRTLTYLSPAIECTEDHGKTTACAGDPVTLTATVEGEKYEWSNGDTLRSITVTAGTETEYWVRTLSSTVTVKNNLMANGDFESNPPSGFESDYLYAGWDPNPLFGTGGTHNDQSGLYVISSSAQRSANTFRKVLPHSGSYFCLIDGDQDGDAWRATTALNPQLVVMKDSVYHFSFWAANINKANENAHPAVLQFRISLDGGVTWQNLGAPYTPPGPGDSEIWGYNEVLYTATASSNNVQIAVRDITSYYGVGNDFALDDIMFQRTTLGLLLEAKRDIYHVEGVKCDHVMDTICAGDTYTRHGYNQEFPTAGDYQLNTGDTVYLHVAQPVVATFTAPASVCDFEGTSLDVDYKVTAGKPSTYSLSFSDSRFTPVTDAPLPAGKITVDIPAGVDAGVFTVDVTLRESGVDCPYEGQFVLSLNAGIPMYSKWTDVIFVDNHDSLFVSYQWYCDGQPIAGATDQYLYDPNGLNGSYFVEIKQTDGTLIRTCESEFGDLQRSAELNPGTGDVPVYKTSVYVVGDHVRIVYTIFTDGTTRAEKQIIR